MDNPKFVWNVYDYNELHFTLVFHLKNIMILKMHFCKQIFGIMDGVQCLSFVVFHTFICFSGTTEGLFSGCLVDLFF